MITLGEPILLLVDDDQQPWLVQVVLRTPEALIPADHVQFFSHRSEVESCISAVISGAEGVEDLFVEGPSFNLQFNRRPWAACDRIDARLGESRLQLSPYKWEIIFHRR